MKKVVKGGIDIEIKKEMINTFSKIEMISPTNMENSTNGFVSNAYAEDSLGNIYTLRHTEGTTGTRSLYKFDETAQKWDKTGQPLPNVFNNNYYPTSFTIHNNIVYAGSYNPNSNAYFSTDFGANWQVLPGAIKGYYFKILPANELSISKVTT